MGIWLESATTPSSAFAAWAGWRRRRLLLAVLVLPLQLGSAAAAGSRDPYGSGVWPDLANENFGDATIVFDDRVRVSAPALAENPMSVPVTVNAEALGAVDRIVVMVDRNPIRKVLEFVPLQAKPVLAFRFKLQQASPVRALARTPDGVWHAGGTWVEATGGGCTLPGASRVSGTWIATLNKVSGAVFPRDGGGARVRLRLMHPMDTGLVAGVPAFYIERIDLRDAAGTRWLQLDLFEPVSENPVLTFDLPRTPSAPLTVSGRDNNGNRIEAVLLERQ
jgi:sulfur-oxidizing protein SoxY